MPDKVVFCWTPDYDDIEQDIIAFLPDQPANPGNIMSYMHIGQHGEASLAFMQDCIPAKPEDYRNLKDELISIGYELEVREQIEPTYDELKAWCKELFGITQYIFGVTFMHIPVNRRGAVLNDFNKRTGKAYDLHTEATKKGLWK